MAARKDDAQRDARRLRSEGKSLRSIARELGVSLSSASVWTRDITPPLPPAMPQPAPPAGTVQMRRCGRCAQRLPLTDFHRNQSWCKRCRANYMRERGELHRQQTRSSWSSTTLRTRRPRSPSWYTRATRLHGFKPKWRAVRSCVRIAIAAARTCVQADPGAWTSSHACPPIDPFRDGTSVSSSITFSTLRVSGAGKRTSWSSNSTT